MAQDHARQDPNVPSIQEVCPHCARMQQLNNQLAQLVDTYRSMVDDLLEERPTVVPRSMPRAA